MTYKCSIKIGLLGTIDYEELITIWNSSKSKFVLDGWRVDWYEDLSARVREKQKATSAILPNEFYEKLYHIVDLGLLCFESFSDDSPLQIVRVYIQDSIVPSFQVQAYHEYLCETPMEALDEVWTHIKSVSTILKNLIQPLGLCPIIDTFSVRFSSNIGSNDINPCVTLKSASNPITILFGDEDLTIDSASIIDNCLWIVKLLEETSEQYLIINLEREHDFAISNLYYSMIVKAKVKNLLKLLNLEYVDYWNAHQCEANRIIEITGVNQSAIKKILLLRTKIQEGSKRFAALSSHVELVKGFLEFHLGTSANSLAEIPLLPNTPGILQSDRSILQIFYMNPLEQVVSKTKRTIEELFDYVTNTTDIFITYTNLRSQALFERLEIMTAILAVISLIISIVVLIK